MAVSVARKPPKNVLTAQDVADMLKVCHRTVLNMAHKGEIPATKIGHLWRFDEEAVLHWLRTKSEPRNDIHPWSENGGLPASIMEILTPETARFEKSVADKREVLEDLASLAVRGNPSVDYNALVQSLVEREEMFPTSIEEGIAFPHPRRPIPGLESPLLAVLVVEAGVEFGHPGSRKTCVFVLFCAPNDATHVRILARLARIFHHQKRLISKLRHISEPERLVRTLIRAEKDKLENTKSSR